MSKLGDYFRVNGIQKHSPKSVRQAYAIQIMQNADVLLRWSVAPTLPRKDFLAQLKILHTQVEQLIENEQTFKNRNQPRSSGNG
jgi:hypothetical protein